MTSGSEDIRAALGRGLLLKHTVEAQGAGRTCQAWRRRGESWSCSSGTLGFSQQNPGVSPTAHAGTEQLLEPWPTRATAGWWQHPEDNASTLLPGIPSGMEVTQKKAVSLIQINRAGEDGGGGGQQKAGASRILSPAPRLG